MLGMKFKRKVQQIIAGTVAAAMTMTIVPDVWLPVYAQTVRKEIENAELGINAETNSSKTMFDLSKTEFEYDEYEFNGNKYCVINKGMSWSDGKKFCEELGGHLLTITSEEEQTFVTDVMLSTDTNMPIYWMGGTSESGTWQWITGEPFEYTNWNPGEPNVEREHYLQTYSNKSIYSKGTWNNHLNCDTSSPYWSIYIQELFVNGITARLLQTRA